MEESSQQDTNNPTQKRKSSRRKRNSISPSRIPVKVSNRRPQRNLISPEHLSVQSPDVTPIRNSQVGINQMRICKAVKFRENSDNSTVSRISPQLPLESYPKCVVVQRSVVRNIPDDSFSHDRTLAWVDATNTFTPNTNSEIEPLSKQSETGSHLSSDCGVKITEVVSDEDLQSAIQCQHDTLKLLGTPCSCSRIISLPHVIRNVDNECNQILSLSPSKNSFHNDEAELIHEDAPSQSCSIVSPISSFDRNNNFDIDKTPTPTNVEVNNIEPGEALQNNQLCRKLFPIDCYNPSSGPEIQTKNMDEFRLPSFQVVTSLSPQRINSTVSCGSNDNRECGNLLSRVTTAKMKSFSKPRNSSNYEDLFYKKKALIASAPTSYRSSRDRETVPFSGVKITRNQQPSGFLSQQQAVLTRIITETITEYEVEDQTNAISAVGNKKPDASRKVGIENKSLRSKIPTTSKKIRKKPPLVTIVETNSECEGDMLSTIPTSRNASDTFSTPQEPLQNEKKASSSVNCTSRPTRIPRLILPGHGDPHLEVPPVKSPGGASATDIEPLFPEMEHRKGKERKHCKKCTASKQLLAESEATIRYLQQLLTSKEHELQLLNTTHSNVKRHDKSTSTAAWNTPVESECAENKDGKLATGKNKCGSSCNNTSTTMNPLLLKKEDNVKQKQNENNKSSAPPCAIPKFDLDEFIRQYFKHILSEDCMDCNGKPFEPSQLLRLSVAARDCVCHELRHKLKNAYITLRQKHEILLSTPLSNTENLADYRIVLDSYRRFVRFIFYYFSESLKDIERFDQTYLAEQRSDDPNRKIRYFHDATMMINNVPYTGVFIPCDQVISDNLIVKTQHC